MATFAELLDYVYTVTGRPDKVAETKLAVKAATLKLHQSDFYPKDLFETGLQWDTLDYQQQVDIKSIFPRFRTLKYLRQYADGVPGKFFEILTPDHLIDSYSRDRSDIGYLAGQIIQLKAKAQFQYALVGMFLNPDITESSFTSWVAQDAPFAIVYEAALTVFKQIGFDEQASMMQKASQEQIALLRQNNLLAVGY